jgi:hypothetical protein
MVIHLDNVYVNQVGMEIHASSKHLAQVKVVVVKDMVNASVVNAIADQDGWVIHA